VVSPVAGSADKGTTPFQVSGPGGLFQRGASMLVSVIPLIGTAAGIYVCIKEVERGDDPHPYIAMLLILVSTILSTVAYHSGM